MPIALGEQIGSLQITALLGKGGMGEVYRARDSRLKRDVAIKILPEEFSHDADRVSRFQREAEVLASLNHPNVAGIYDIQEAGGSRFLVLELVEGETLADRIVRGPISVYEALNIAKEICEALEAAHEKGIVHRDLKPSNVKITPDGHVKVLDFGLAKALEPSAANTPLSNSPTRIGGSIAGMIIGTAAYMSPEQARGRVADARSDVFAFGCVLYEMLTGKQAFEGEDVSDLLASVMKVDVDFDRLPSNLDPRLMALLRRCLAKNRKDRWHAIGDVRFEIEELMRGGVKPTAQARHKSGRLWILAASLFALLTVVLGFLSVRGRPAPTESIHLSVVAPEGTEFGDGAERVPAISPDGRQLAFVAGDRNSGKLWVRSLNSDDARMIEDSDGAAAPFWSPDSRSIGFFAQAKLYRVDIGGGKPQVICSLESNSTTRVSGTWNSEGTIVFGLDAGRALSRVSSEGGPVTPVTTIDKTANAETGHFRPMFLPDGKHFLFLLQQRDGADGIYAGSLDSKEIKPVLTGVNTSAYYTPSGQLLFVRTGTLFAQQFNVKTLELQDKPIRLADSILSGGRLNAGFANFSVSATGVLVYRTGTGAARTQLTWLDRSGKVLETVGTVGANFNPRLSPDGTRVAASVQNTAGGVEGIWVFGPGNVSSRIAERGTFPVWSADGRRLIYRGGAHDLRILGKAAVVQKSVLSEGSDEQALIPDPPFIHVDDLSPDNQYIVGTARNGETNRDVVAVPLSAADKLIKVAMTSAQELYGRISPDGHWIAYSSDETGTSEVYVQSFPNAGPKILISRNGGSWPVWRRDGKELFYLSGGSKVMAVSISGGNTLQPGIPQPLFDVRVSGGGIGSPSHFDATPDGKRFLVNMVAAESASSPIHVVLNWTELLKR